MTGKSTEEYEKEWKKMDYHQLMIFEDEIREDGYKKKIFEIYKKLRCPSCNERMSKVSGASEESTISLYQCFKCKTVQWINSLEV